MASALAVEGLAVEALAVEGLAIETLTIEALVVEGLAVEALAIGDLAVEAVAAPAFTTGDSSGAWLEFPSDLMDGAAGGGTGTAKTCPGFFWGSLSGIAPLDKPTSVDAGAMFSVGAAAEPCAEALPVRRMPNPRTRASSTTLAKIRAARQRHPVGRSGGCGFSLGSTGVVSAGVVSTSVVSTSVASTGVGSTGVGRTMVVASTAQALGGSTGTDGNGSGGKIKRATSSPSSSGAGKTSAAGETALGAGCGASSGNSTASTFGPVLTMTGSSGG